MAEQSLYDRLGGVFAIAAVVNHFSDAVVQNPIVGQGSENPDLREWHTNKLDRLPGLLIDLEANDELRPSSRSSCYEASMPERCRARGVALTNREALPRA
jgi:hypothetical protein